MRLITKKLNLCKAALSITGLLLSFLFAPPPLLAQFIVINTNDMGGGSLRDAISAANLDPNPNVITFDPATFPAAAPVVIFVGSTTGNPLPNMTGLGDSIDGSGAGVIIDGTNLPGDTGVRVRASNVVIQGITFQNFVGNDAVRVEARDATPVVTDVTILGNLFRANRRAIQVTGGIGSFGRSVGAFISANTIEDVESGIRVVGNATGDAGGNSVDAVIENNVLRRTFQSVPGVLGDGINIGGATDAGSNNIVTATVTNNAIFDVIDDGITAHGCGAADTGENNLLGVFIANNDVKFFINAANPTPPGIRNSGITVGGASGESAAASFCHDNVVRFDIFDNTVSGFPTRNIGVSGGSIGTGRHDVQANISGNIVQNSRDGTGISVTPGAGDEHFIHDVTIAGNKVSGNARRGIIISGATSTNSVMTRIDVLGNTVDGSLPKSPQYSIVPDVNQDGIIVTGSSDAVNAVLSEILIDGNITKNSQRHGIIVTRGNEPSNAVSISGITNNLSTRNSRDGIVIASNVPGTGSIPVASNQCNDNGEDGIDINSPGYGLSNNSCSRNLGDSINAVVGNTNDGGNSGRRNGDCNQPSFCFNTPVP